MTTARITDDGIELELDATEARRLADTLGPADAITVRISPRQLARYADAERALGEFIAAEMFAGTSQTLEPCPGSSKLFSVGHTVDGYLTITCPDCGVPTEAENVSPFDSYVQLIDHSRDVDP